MNRLLGCVALAFALTACGAPSHGIDRVGWVTALKAQGVATGDWDHYQNVWIMECDKDEGSLSLFVAAGLDAGISDAVLRTNLDYACPRNVDVLNKIRGLSDAHRLACELPISARTEEQQRTVEALGCQALR